MLLRTRLLVTVDPDTVTQPACMAVQAIAGSNQSVLLAALTCCRFWVHVLCVCQSPCDSETVGWQPMVAAMVTLVPDVVKSRAIFTCLGRVVIHNLY